MEWRLVKDGLGNDEWAGYRNNQLCCYAYKTLRNNKIYWKDSIHGLLHDTHIEAIEYIKEHYEPGRDKNW
jgi:hypothetical protein